MKNLLEKQIKVLERIDKKLESDQLLQKSQIVAQGQSDIEAARMASELADRDSRIEKINENIYVELKKHTDFFKKQYGDPSRPKGGGAEAEKENERAQKEKQQLTLLQEIRDRIGLTKEGKGDKIEGFGMGGLAVGLGVLAGTFMGQLKAFIETIKFTSKLLPTSVIDGIKAGLNFFKEGLSWVARLGSNIMEFVKWGLAPLFEKVGVFFRPIAEAFKSVSKLWAPLEGFVMGIKSFFVNVAGKATAFGGIFGAVTKVVSKIAYPLTIIMGIWDTVKGFIEGFEEGGLIGGIKGAIVGLYNGLVFGFADMVKGMVSWVLELIGLDSIAKWLDSFSFQDLFKRFVDFWFSIPSKLYGMIADVFDSIGEIFSNVWSWMKTIPDKIMEFIADLPPMFGIVWDVLNYIPSKLFEFVKSIPTHISDLFSTLWESLGALPDLFSEYVIEPVKGLFNKYVAEPFKGIFDPVVNFFKNLKDNIINFFEDVGIPEIGFTIPIINKKVSIGPFYPFRPEKGTTRIGSNTQLSSRSSSDGTESQTMNQNIVTAGTHYVRDEKTGQLKLSDDKTQVMTVTSRQTNDSSTLANSFATFDPRTGKATLSRETDTGQEYDKEISKRAFNRIKKNAQEGGDAANVDTIVKEDEMYQKLGWLDKRKVDAGLAKTEDLYNAMVVAKRNELESKLAKDKAIGTVQQEDGTMRTNFRSGGYSITDSTGERRYDAKGNEIYTQGTAIEGVAQRRYADSMLGASAVIKTENGPASTVVADPKGNTYTVGANGKLIPVDAASNRSVVADASREVDAGARATAVTPVIVNAPTTMSSNNNQNIAMPRPVRNQDASFNRYVGTMAGFE